MQQLNRAADLTPQQMTLALQISTQAMADTTTCLHCWLRQKFQEVGLDPDYAPDLWSVLSKTHPSTVVAFWRLLSKETTYVEDQHAQLIARRMDLGPEESAEFFGLISRNRSWHKRDGNKLAALQVCSRT